MNALPPRLPVELAGLRDWGAPNGSLAMRMMPLFVAGLFMIAALSLAAGRFGADRAIAELAREAQTTASLHSSILQTELGKYRSVPYILGHDGEVRKALATRDPALLRDLDRKLEVVSQETGATVLYVVDAKAKGLSGSNWRTHKPFCQGPPLDLALKLHRAAGCHDRLYYTEAMRTGIGRDVRARPQRQPSGRLLFSRRGRWRAAAWRRGGQGAIRHPRAALARRGRSHLRHRRKRRGVDHQHPRVAPANPSAP
jgi:hypothetical protein